MPLRTARERLGTVEGAAVIDEYVVTVTATAPGSDSRERDKPGARRAGS